MLNRHQQFLAGLAALSLLLLPGCATSDQAPHAMGPQEADGVYTTTDDMRMGAVRDVRSEPDRMPSPSQQQRLDSDQPD